jgi:signal transduction histidine kinase
MNHTPKNSAIQVANHPFPVLLYLEWGLLAIGLFSALMLPAPLINGSFQSPFIPVMILVIFAIMGLRLPREKTHARVHAAIGLALIVLATLTGIRSRVLPFFHLYPFLYIVFVIRGCLMFRFQERILITATAFSWFLVVLFYRVQNSDWIRNLNIPNFLQERIQSRLRLLNWGFALTAALLMGLALLFIFLLVHALLSERQSREQVAIANQQLRHYALRVEALAMEQERNRIARDLHDALGHSLTALNLQLESALKLWQSHPDRAQTFLQEAKQMGSTALQEVRQAVSTLRANPLQGKSLEAAIALLLEEFQRSTGILPTCHYLPVPLDSMPLDSELNITLYRIVQEALTNISKHAHATQVNIQVQRMTQRVHLRIQDDGQGFDWQHNRTGFGLQGMRERVMALGGTMAIVSAAGQGCQVTVEIPVEIPIEIPIEIPPSDFPLTP